MVVADGFEMFPLSQCGANESWRDLKSVQFCQETRRPFVDIAAVSRATLQRRHTQASRRQSFVDFRERLSFELYSNTGVAQARTTDYLIDWLVGLIGWSTLVCQVLYNMHGEIFYSQSILFKSKKISFGKVDSLPLFYRLLISSCWIPQQKKDNWSLCAVISAISFTTLSGVCTCPEDHPRVLGGCVGAGVRITGIPPYRHQFVVSKAFIGLRQIGTSNGFIKLMKASPQKAL